MNSSAALRSRLADAWALGIVAAVVLGAGGAWLLRGEPGVAAERVWLAPLAKAAYVLPLLLLVALATARAPAWLHRLLACALLGACAFDVAGAAAWELPRGVGLGALVSLVAAPLLRLARLAWLLALTGVVALGFGLPAGALLFDAARLRALPAADEAAPDVLLVVATASDAELRAALAEEAPRGRRWTAAFADPDARRLVARVLASSPAGLFREAGYATLLVATDESADVCAAAREPAYLAAALPVEPLVGAFLASQPLRRPRAAQPRPPRAAEVWRDWGDQARPTFALVVTDAQGARELLALRERAPHERPLLTAVIAHPGPVECGRDGAPAAACLHPRGTRCEVLLRGPGVAPGSEGPSFVRAERVQERLAALALGRDPRSSATDADLVLLDPPDGWAQIADGRLVLHRADGVEALFDLRRDPDAEEDLSSTEAGRLLVQEARRAVWGWSCLGYSD